MEDYSELNFTGERLVTKIFEYWTLEHLHRYAVSIDFIKDKVVLDLACGEGYGSNILAHHCESIIGIDISEETIENAKKKYKHDNLRFILGSAIKVPLENKSVDVVVCFETIEHHDKHDEMMKEIRRVLRKDGLLIISSPDKKNYSDIPQYNNPFHVKELYTDEFLTLIKANFEHTYMLYQKSVFGSVISTSDPASKGLKEYTGNYSEVCRFDVIQNPMYNICFASQNLLPEIQLNANSYFYSGVIMENYKRDKEEL